MVLVLLVVGGCSVLRVAGEPRGRRGLGGASGIAGRVACRLRRGGGEVARAAILSLWRVRRVFAAVLEAGFAR